MWYLYSLSQFNATVELMQLQWNCRQLDEQRTVKAAACTYVHMYDYMTPR